MKDRELETTFRDFKHSTQEQTTPPWGWKCPVAYWSENKEIVNPFPPQFLHSLLFSKQRSVFALYACMND